MNRKLILDLTSLGGTARQVISAHAQKEMFKMGYVWAATLDQNVSETSAPYLVVGGGGNRHGHIYKISMETKEFRGADVFNGSDSLEYFLDVARQHLNAAKRTKEVFVNGVKIILSKNGAEFVFDDLINALVDQAKEMWLKEFPQH